MPSQLDCGSVAERVLNAQAELQTPLGMMRLEGIDPYIEMRLQACLAMLHGLLDDLGRPMYSPAQMPEGWTPA